MIGSREFALIMGCLIALSATAATATEPRAKNTALRPLLDCRKVTQAPERLACFDRESATLDAADEKNEITVLDKAAVRETRRSLFGLSLPHLPFFGGGKDDGDKGKSEALDSLQATILSARELDFGKWQIGLDDGAQWVTTEAIVGRSPSQGKKIEIKRGAVGSYMGKIEGGRAVRMRRVN